MFKREKPLIPSLKNLNCKAAGMTLGCSWALKRLKKFATEPQTWNSQLWINKPFCGHSNPISSISIDPTSIRQFHLHLILRLQICRKKNLLPPHSTPHLSTPISITKNSHPKKKKKPHSCFQVQLCRTVNYVPNWIKPNGCIEFMTNQQIGPATLTNNSWISIS